MKPQYQQEINRIIEEVKFLIFDEPNWQLKKDSKGNKIFCTDVPGVKWRCWKGETIVNMSPEKVLDIVHPTAPYRPQFDENLDKCELIEELSENTAIVRHKFKKALMGIVSPRDSYDIVQFDKTPDYHYSILGSIKYENGPEDPKFIRGWGYPMGFLAFPTSDPNQSRVVAISHMDFRLPKEVPQAVVEKAVPKEFSKYFKSLKKMENAPYTRLTAETPLCRNRK